MSWMAKLYETYEKSMALDLTSDKKPMPISHTLQNAHINIVIDGDGNFKRASVLEKTQIVLPATEKSAGRSGRKPPPHPLDDKLQYVAKDYSNFGGENSFYVEYQVLLTAWCESEVGHPKAKAVLEYVNKGEVISDLISVGILHVDENKLLLRKWLGEVSAESPQPIIFRLLPKKEDKKTKEKYTDQGAALVCWSVEEKGVHSSDTWTDKSLQQSWIDFDALTDGIQGLCYISGLEQTVASNHPAKLRHTGDKAKLVSANDMSGFTFKGRFTDNKKSLAIHGVQAVGIGLEVTQKAHNALRWLISRQGYRNGDQVYVSWAVSGKDIPEPLASSWDMFDEEPTLQVTHEPARKSVIDHTLDLGDGFATRLNKYIAGYHAKLDPNEQIVIMGLDSATPGRMGMIYYRELLASEFLDRIHLWHSDFAWPQRYTKEFSDPGNNKKAIRKVIWPVSSPVPRVIAEVAYCNILKSDKKKLLEKSLIERIVPCIVDGRPFPQDIMMSAVRLVSNRSTKRLAEQFSNFRSEEGRWEKHLGVACALFKGFYLRHPVLKKRRTYRMALEEDRTTRDYLYGRLLAIAERIEEMSMIIAKEKPRTTFASRLMQRFSDNPYSTWLNIEKGIVPYMERLKSNIAPLAEGYKRLLDDVCDAFKVEDFMLKKQLSGEYLLGFHSQRKWFREFKLEQGKWVKKNENENIESEQ